MPNTKSAIKRVKQSQKRRLRNVMMKSRIRTSIRRYKLALQDGTEEQQIKRFSEVTSLLDKGAAKGVIHKNEAARRKSRLAASLRKVSTNS